MNTYAIIHDQGYGFEKADVLTQIDAKSPQSARKEFFKKWAGHYTTQNPKRIRATKI